MALGDIWQVELQAFSSSQLAINVHWYRVITSSGSAPANEPQNYANAFDTALAPTLIACMSADSAAYWGTRAQRWFPLPKQVFGFSANHQSNPGGAAGVFQPGQVAGVLKKYTPFAGRKYRGRAYIPFPSINAIDTGDVNSRPTVAYRNLLTSHGTALLGPITVVDGGVTDTLAPVLFEPKTGLYTAISLYSPDDAWGTQRRRGNFGRPNLVA